MGKKKEVWGQERIVNLLASKTVLAIKENGKFLYSDKILVGFAEPRFDKARVFRFGPMAPCMKAGGKIIKPMAKAASSMPMVISMTASGRTTKPMVLAFTLILTVLVTRVTGRKINSMARVSRPGLMVPAMRAIMSMARNTAMESSLGLMEAHMQVNL
jgi:hypothetical protein